MPFRYDRGIHRTDGGFVALHFCAMAGREHISHSSHLTDVLRIGSIILLFNALNGAQGGALAGFEAFKTIARISLFVGLADLPLIVGGCYTCRGERGSVGYGRRQWVCIGS